MLHASILFITFKLLIKVDFGCGSKNEKTLASPNNDIGFIEDRVVLTEDDKKLLSSFLKQI
jgi:hypothetical protein